MVECTALEMRHTGNRIGGSNPSLSASYEFQRISANTHEAKKPNVYGVSFSHYRYAHHAHAFHRQHRARRAELSIPLITRLKNPKANVCFWHKADISRLSPNVRFLGVKQTYPNVRYSRESGHSREQRLCLLCAKSGHRRREAVEKPIRTPCQSAYRRHTGRRRGRRSRGRAATTTRRTHTL